MRIKTFLSTYILFLCVLFTVIGTISVFMTRSQMSMLRDKSAREYQTISASLSRDLAVMFGLTGGFTPEFWDAKDVLIYGYANYYSKYDISLSLSELHGYIDAQISFVQTGQEHFINITGPIQVSYRFYRFEYLLNITQNIEDLRSIQRILLVLSLAFSLLTAIGLYIILLRIFLPISIVAESSKKIAGGSYDERIRISGSNELSAMAENFNKMAEEVERQITGKQQFIDNFSHEIRSPLTSVYGYAEYLHKAPYDAAITTKATQTIMDEANHMKAIADSLLKLATLRNYTPVKTLICMTRLLNDVIQGLDSQVKFTCKNSAGNLQGQEDLLKSLLINLCINAIAACATEITLEAAKNDDSTVVSVTDNGNGIAPEDITKITEPFYRADKARGRAYKGAGLGLTLCKQIAEAHDAKMRIESVFGAGTTVFITFTGP